MPTSVSMSERYTQNSFLRPHLHRNRMYQDGLKSPNVLGCKKVQQCHREKMTTDIMGSLSLFGPYGFEKEPAPITIPLKKIASVDADFFSWPTTFNRFAKHITQRLSGHDELPYLSLQDLRELSAEENAERHRQMSAHVVLECENLLNRYVRKAKVFNERGIFSSPANMTRLKTQLSIEAAKLLNPSSIWRSVQVTGVLRSGGGQGATDLPQDGVRTVSSVSKTLPPFGSVRQTSYHMSNTVNKTREKLTKDLSEIAEAMPYLNTTKLLNMMASISCEGIEINHEDRISLLAKICEGRSPRNAGTSKDRMGCSVFKQTMELGRIVSFCGYCVKSSYEQQVPAVVQIEQMALYKNLPPFLQLSVPSIRPPSADVVNDGCNVNNNIPDFGQLDDHSDDFDLESHPSDHDTVVNRSTPSRDISITDDLKQLMHKAEQADCDTGADEDMPSLLQAIVRHARHDGSLKQSQDHLRKMDRRKATTKKLSPKPPTHPQPATVITKINDKVIVRTSDIRVSERVCMSTLTLPCFPPVYNDLADELDIEMVKDLDKGLCSSTEIREVYREILKTSSSTHLQLDSDDFIQPAADVEDAVGILASSLPSKRPAAINHSLMLRKEHPWGCDEDMTKWAETLTTPAKSSKEDNIPITLDVMKIHEVMLYQLKTALSGRPTFLPAKLLHSYPAWLQWWRSTLHIDDYLKYLSTVETDYMRLIYHLYDSDGDLEDDDLEHRHGHQVKRRASGRRSQQLREVDAALDSLWRQKTEFRSGFWNTNCVLMGGLGGDPKLHETKDRNALLSSVQREIISDVASPDSTSREQNSKTWPSCKRSSVFGSSGATTTTDNSHFVNDRGVDESKEEEPLQSRLQYVWDTLQMSDSLRLDMAIKYSDRKFSSKLSQVVENWETVAADIVKRERLLIRLQEFEKTASDPNRFFARRNGLTKSSTLLLGEARYRSFLYRKIELLDREIKLQLEYINDNFSDVVSYQGRPYVDKMKWDRVEMLHWLQEERKQDALRYESSMQHVAPPPDFTEPFSDVAT